MMIAFIIVKSIGQLRKTVAGISFPVMKDNSTGQARYVIEVRPFQREGWVIKGRKIPFLDGKD